MTDSKFGPLASRAALTVLLAAMGAKAAAVAPTWLTPEFVNEVIRYFGAGPAQAGFVASIEMAMMAATSLTLARFVPHAAFRSIFLWGAAVALLGNVLALLASGFPTLVAARIIAGAGAGAIYVVASSAVIGLPDRERAYALIGGASIVYGTLITAGLPFLREVIGDQAVLPAILIVCLLPVPLAFLLPRDLVFGADFGKAPVSPAAKTPVRPAGRFGPTIVLLAGAVLLYGTASNAIWAFYVVFGQRTGMPPDVLSRAIAIAIATSVLGAVAASVIGARFGRFLPAVLGLLVSTVATVTIAVSTDVLLYRIAICANVACVYFLLAYFFGYAAEADPSGRGPAVIGATMMLTGAIGPSVSGLLMEAFDSQAVGYVVAAMQLVALGLVGAVHLRMKGATPLRKFAPSAEA